MFILLNEKDYQKAKSQIETLSKRKTLLVSALGSIQSSYHVQVIETFFCFVGLLQSITV